MGHTATAPLTVVMRIPQSEPLQATFLDMAKAKGGALLKESFTVGIDNAGLVHTGLK